MKALIQHCTPVPGTKSDLIECIERMSYIEYLLAAGLSKGLQFLKLSQRTGKLAACTVLSQNPLTVDSRKIKTIRVEASWVGGNRFTEMSEAASRH